MIEKFNEAEFFRMLKGRLDERMLRIVAVAAAGAVVKGDVGGIAAASGCSRAELLDASSRSAVSTRASRGKASPRPS